VKALPNNNFEVTSSGKCKVDAQDKTNSIQIKVQQCAKVPNAKKALVNMNDQNQRRMWRRPKKWVRR